jgi:hypothetical protein
MGGPAQQPYGGHPQQPYGGPPPQDQGFGMPVNAGAAGAAALAQVQNPMGPLVAGAKPRARNPLMTAFVPLGVIVLGCILSFILSLISPTIGSLVGGLVMLAGSVLYLISSIAMLRELQNYTQDQQFVWWWLFIPCLGLYFAIIKVPEQVKKAKEKAGIIQTKPVRPFVFYLIPALWPFALASDLNDIAAS